MLVLERNIALPQHIFGNIGRMIIDARRDLEQVIVQVSCSGPYVQYPFFAEFKSSACFLQTLMKEIIQKRITLAILFAIIAGDLVEKITYLFGLCLHLIDKHLKPKLKHQERPDLIGVITLRI